MVAAAMEVSSRSHRYGEGHEHVWRGVVSMAVAASAVVCVACIAVAGRRGPSGGPAMLSDSGGSFRAFSTVQASPVAPPVSVGLGKPHTRRGSHAGEREVQSAVRKAVVGAEARVKRDVESEIQSAVKEAVERTVASSSGDALMKSRRGQVLVRTLVKDAGSAAVEAGEHEVQEYASQMSRVAQALESELGGMVSADHRGGNSGGGEAGRGKGPRNWESLAASILQRQAEARRGRRHTVARLAHIVKEKQEFSHEEKRIAREAAMQAGLSPSAAGEMRRQQRGRGDGAGARAQTRSSGSSRDQVAAQDLKMLRRLREASRAKTKLGKKTGAELQKMQKSAKGAAPAPATTNAAASSGQAVDVKTPSPAPSPPAHHRLIIATSAGQPTQVAVGARAC